MSILQTNPLVRESASLTSIAESTPKPRVTALVLLSSDLFCLTLALLVSGLIGLIAGRTAPTAQILWCVVDILVTLCFMAMNGLYPALGTNELVESKCVVQCISLVQLGRIFLLWTTHTKGLKLQTLIFWALAMVAVILGRSITRGLFSSRHWWGEPVLLIGSGPDRDEVSDLLEADFRLGLHPAAILDETGNLPFSLALPIFHDLSHSLKFAETNKIQTAIIVLGESGGLTVAEANNRYAFYFSKLVMVPHIGPRRGTGSRAKALSGYLSSQVSEVLLMQNRRMLKRCIDFLVAVIALVVLSPLMLMIALAVKLTSKGPIFYGHPRIGRNSATFRAWKFRTMVSNADVYLTERLASSPALREEWQQNHKLRRDPRVTRVGAILRKLSLDELPQLWNVLCLEMSIVGPRPIISDEVLKYHDCFLCYSRVLPGITGLWQISGRNETTYEERVQLDTYYVTNWSLWLDIWIIARTFKTVLSAHGAY